MELTPGTSPTRLRHATVKSRKKTNRPLLKRKASEDLSNLARKIDQTKFNGEGFDNDAEQK
jgi:hypothetical protein